jgi:hypothetical protein
MRIFTLTALFLFLAGMAFAADIDGTWTGEVQGMGGGEAMKIEYSFKADGKTLNGSTKGPDGSEMAFTDGKIDGKDFSFAIDFGMGMPMKFNGVLKGAKMELKMDMSGMPDMGGGQGGEMPEMPPIVLTKTK